jgi:hypothetical protein
MHQFDWTYLYLVHSRLIDAHTLTEVNEYWPSFDSLKQAAQYLNDRDIHATVISIYGGNHAETKNTAQLL